MLRPALFRLRRTAQRPAGKDSFLARLLHPSPDTAPVTLTQRRIFILPTRAGLGFALLLLLMLLGSINYGNSMGFVLTFLLASLAVVSILHTWRNLARLIVSAGRSEAVFAGQDARFQVCLDNADDYARPAIGLRAGKAVGEVVNLAPHASGCLAFAVPAPVRGRLRAPGFSLETSFPLGLFRAWSPLDLDLTCLVYPQPASARLPLPETADYAGDGPPRGEGHEDFAGLRSWHPGESLRQVAWKAVAREQGMLAKQFMGGVQADTLLDWEDLADPDPESRLSRLARWVLDAESAGRRYGLRLPGVSVAPDRGQAHCHRCLEALALHRP